MYEGVVPMLFCEFPEDAKWSRREAMNGSSTQSEAPQHLEEQVESAEQRMIWEWSVSTAH